jgi:hypothetical protein
MRMADRPFSVQEKLKYSCSLPDAPALIPIDEADRRLREGGGAKPAPPDEPQREAGILRPPAKQRGLGRLVDPVGRWRCSAKPLANCFCGNSTPMGADSRRRARLQTFAQERPSCTSDEVRHERRERRGQRLTPLAPGGGSASQYAPPTRGRFPMRALAAWPPAGSRRHGATTAGANGHAREAAKEEATGRGGRRTMPEAGARSF